MPAALLEALLSVGADADADADADVDVDDDVVLVVAAGVASLVKVHSANGNLLAFVMPSARLRCSAFSSMRCNYEIHIECS